MKLSIRFAALLGVIALAIGSVPKNIWAEEIKKNQYWPEGPQIVSEAGIVMEAETGTVLYEKNIHDPHYPASITKILTTLLAVENSKMDEVVTFSHDSVYNTEGSGIARDVGEEMTMEQCLYGVMLASANECAYAVAEHVGGDINTFIQMMNDRAAALGCQNTHFNNCNGLPDEEHYVSAYDMALIAREAYKNETFRIICGTKSYTIPFTNKHTDEETLLHNHHQMLYPLRTRQYLYDYCLGGKTGYTSAANYTLVTYAEKDGVTLICVVLDSPAGSNYDDTRALFDFCFDNFKMVNVSDREETDTQSKEDSKGILGSYAPFVALDESSHIILPITAEFADVDSNINYNDQDEDVLGSMEYTYAGRLVGKADITAADVVVDTFEFHEQSEAETSSSAAGDSDEKESEAGRTGIFLIEPKMIAAGIAGIGLFGILIFLIWKFVDNFYKIKRMLHLNKKEKSPYTTIKQNKMFPEEKKEMVLSGDKMEALDTKLEAYAREGYYPFHMPGHKRNALAMPNPYTIDITEIDGFDNLHQPEGILKEAQKRAADLYGAAQSFYLVNGSTCGLLAAVFAAVPRGGTILMARNAHKAVYHAVYLRSLSAEYLYPNATEFGISGSIDPHEVKQKLDQNPAIGAVLVTSPTYEGVVSDISAIAEVVHSYGIPLIVDEAHGAHFGFHTAFPQTAVQMGADIVVQSMHKVLPSLTQTALLHLNSAYIAPAAVKRYLGMFETSSPSYVLMAGMEKCIRLLTEKGGELFADYASLLEDFYRKTDELSRIHLMQRKDFTADEIYGLDPSKIVISVKNTSKNGEWLYQALLERFRLQMEMVSGFYVLGMTSIMDGREGFARLDEALKELDREISGEHETIGHADAQFVQQLYAPREQCLRLCEAMDLPTETVSFEQAVGRISGCMVSLYPPGIPILLSGERIDEDFLKNIRKCRKFRLNVQGIADIINERIDVVK